MKNAEVPEGVIKVPIFKTPDFEFVAVALALQEPPVRLVGKEPFDHPTMQRGQVRRKYLFVLACPPNKHIPDWEEKLQMLSLRYMNCELLVEPTSVAAKRKFLRGYLFDADNTKNKGNSKGRKGTSHDS